MPSTQAVVLQSFATASANAGAARMWKLLSPASQRRLGPYARFRSHAPKVPTGRLAMARVVDAVWAVGALSGSSGAFAAPLRRAPAGWRVELAAPIHLAPIGTNEVGPVSRAPGQLAAAIRAAGPVGKAAMWPDGRGFGLDGGGTSRSNITVFGRPPGPVRDGRHVVVAFATAGAAAVARAWTFTH
ncbi:MAG: hypothetical protein ABR569_08925 [Gaiellaceae bacterium]